jgi:hypothetical protein
VPQVWEHEVFALPLPPKPAETAWQSVLRINVLDHDSFSANDDLGEATCALHQAAGGMGATRHMMDQAKAHPGTEVWAIKPQWLPLLPRTTAPAPAAVPTAAGTSARRMSRVAEDLVGKAVTKASNMLSSAAEAAGLVHAEQDQREVRGFLQGRHPRRATHPAAAIWLNLPCFRFLPTR